jgi:hypothetical protein
LSASTQILIWLIHFFEFNNWGSGGYFQHRFVAGLVHAPFLLSGLNGKQKRLPPYSRLINIIFKPCQAELVYDELPVASATFIEV